MDNRGAIRKTFPLVIALALLISTLALTQFTYLASGNMMFPEQAPRGIRITSNGFVEGTDKIQQSGNTYTLTGDIGESIVVLRDGIVLNGAGYTLGGTGSGTGIFIQGRDKVTIKNLRITNFNYGIKLTWLNYDSSDYRRSVTISGNIIIGNKYGIAFIQDAPQCEISNNHFADNTYAVYYPSGAILRGNQFKNNGYCIYDDYSINNVDSSNTVNEKPIYYWVNQQDKTVPANAGWVALKNCKNITVQGLNLNGVGGDGLSLYNTNSSTINGNTIGGNSNGITLQASHGNTISNNRLINNKEYGILIESSCNNSAIKNQIAGNLKDGVLVEYHSFNNTITQNQIIGNNDTGVNLKTMQAFEPVNIKDFTTLSQNTISKNGVGIWINNAIRNIIILNNITENNGWGIKLEGTQKNNIIHHNNFINNNVTDALQVCIGGFFNQTVPSRINNGTLAENGSMSFAPPKIEFVGGSANFWDNGRGGNYWSDYMTRYPNASNVDKTGVGNTPFYINENNMDRYPLMAPVNTSNVDSALPILEPTSQDSQAQQDSFSSAIIIVPIVSVAFVSAGLLVYFKKYRIKRSLSPSALQPENNHKS